MGAWGGSNVSFDLGGGGGMGKLIILSQRSI